MKTKDIEAIIKDNPSAIFSGTQWGTFTIEGFEFESRNRHSTPTKVAKVRYVNAFTREDGECHIVIGSTAKLTLTQISCHIFDSAPEMLDAKIKAKAKQEADLRARTQVLSMTTDAKHELRNALINNGITPTSTEVKDIYGKTSVVVALTAEQAAALVQILNQK